MFSFEWTRRRDAGSDDEERGLEAVENHCAKHGLNAAAIYSEMVKAIEEWPQGETEQRAIDAWCELERIAIDAMCAGWARQTENATLIWTEPAKEPGQ